MASPEKVAPLLPETLPEDFSEWDGEASPAPLPVNTREWETWEAAHSFPKALTPLYRAPEREASGPHVVNTPEDIRRGSSAPVPVKQPKDVDSEPSLAPMRVASNEWEAWAAAHSLGKSAKLLGHTAEREAAVPQVVEKPRDARRTSPAPVVLKQPEPLSESAGESPSPASQKLEAGPTANMAPAAPTSPSAVAVDETARSPEPAAALSVEAGDAISPSLSLKSLEAEEEVRAPKRKWMMMTAVGAGAILLPSLLLIPRFYHGRQSAANPSVQPAPAATDAQPQTDTPNISDSESSTQDKPSAATAKPETTDKQPADQKQAADPPQGATKIQAQMMNDQLTAPTQIPRNVNQQVAENGPPPESLGGDGLAGSGANVGLFKGRAQPVIKPARSGPLAISSGVATGLLVQKTPPVYPPIAKTARVSGTVVLHAVISKTGAIRDLQVLNGPVMLREAALDAVRTWRYKPYKLDNQPTDVETTISVVFSLGN
jgi:periplasmic protein TonB